MTSTDSEPATATLDLQGVWLHDPLDPEGTARQFFYGANSRSDATSVPATSTHYAGRTFPVVEFGEHQEHVVDAAVFVPSGATSAADLAALLDFAEARRTLMYRDNRGRAVYGHLAGLKRDDQPAGTAVAFTFARVDYDAGDEVAG